jgi:phage tail protein X
MPATARVGEMALTYETVQISGDRITPSLLIWRRYRRPAPGMLGLFLRANPAAAVAVAGQPFLPIGMKVMVPIDSEILSGAPIYRQTVKLYGRA